MESDLPGRSRTAGHFLEVLAEMVLRYRVRVHGFVLSNE